MKGRSVLVHDLEITDRQGGAVRRDEEDKGVSWYALKLEEDLALGVWPPRRINR
jgi:hypothetical protein